MIFFKNPRKKEIELCKELLEMVDKVRDFRKDVMREVELQDLEKGEQSLKAVMKEGSINDIKEKRGELDEVLKKCGGNIYPMGFWADNVETFLIAAILAISIRTFFFQPFVIPTNSMYPTYNGMTHQTYAADSQKPSFLKRLGRMVQLGASHYEVESTAKGELLIPLAGFSGTSGSGPFAYKTIKGRKWFGLLSEPRREYTFYVDAQPVVFDVPFDFDQVPEIIQETYFPDVDGVEGMLEGFGNPGKLARTPLGLVLKTGKEVKRGDSIINFDILKGDMLFVNRIAYHFTKPKLGDAIVFRTENIERFRDSAGNPIEKYFIKRLVGMGGDQLQVRPPYLYRNGSPISGVPAFDWVQSARHPYNGYTQMWDMEGGRTVNVPEDHYYGMGDNSRYSADSRRFGSVPKNEMVGRASFIFYPFSKHWGISN